MRTSAARHGNRTENGRTRRLVSSVCGLLVLHDEVLCGGVELAAEEYGIACRKGSDLTAEINKLTDELKADGTMDKLAEKYELTLAK